MRNLPNFRSAAFAASALAAVFVSGCDRGPSATEQEILKQQAAMTEQLKAMQNTINQGVEAHLKAKEAAGSLVIREPSISALDVFKEAGITPFANTQARPNPHNPSEALKAGAFLTLAASISSQLAFDNMHTPDYATRIMTDPRLSRMVGEYSSDTEERKSGNSVSALLIQSGFMPASNTDFYYSFVVDGKITEIKGHNSSSSSVPRPLHNMIGQEAVRLASEWRKPLITNGKIKAATVGMSKDAR
ncbi:MAG: hypothetical protein WAZ18_06070 [Alphaproteobacteria bacterium]